MVILSDAWSSQAGFDLGTFLCKHDSSMRTRAEREEVAKNLSVVFLHTGMSAWIPFGKLHAVVAVPGERESKKTLGQKKKPGGQKKTAAITTEYAQFLWLPCLSNHFLLEADKVSKVLSKMVAWREWSHLRVEQNAEWLEFVSQLELKAKACPVAADDGNKSDSD